MRGLFVALALLSATPASAQMHSRPSEAPIVTAENETWYHRGEPVYFAGDLYFQAGARVFFNGNTMVRTGDHQGVPLYADATLEPYSIVYVPIERGQLQPYERRRRGELAGTTGSRTPSFPVSSVGSMDATFQAAISPTSLTQDLSTRPIERPAFTAGVVQVAASAPAPADGQVDGVPLLRPENNDGIWVEYGGFKWVSAGEAVPLRASDFYLLGDYAGFPVFARQRVKEDVIYIPSRAGLVAPYRRKP
jgi:hypothetical protein